MSGIIRVEFAPALMTRELAAYYIGDNLAGLDLLKRQNILVPVGKKKRVQYRKTDLDRYVESLEERPDPKSKSL